MVTEGGEMSRPPSSQTTPQFYRVSDRDLTEIELHSVDSINDLHRIHPEHSHKGTRPPRPPSYPPSSNGNLSHMHGMVAVNQRSKPINRKWQSRLQDMVIPSSTHGTKAMGCAFISLLLLTATLILCFLVQQGGALQILAEAVREKQAVSTEISQLMQELKALRHNLTVLRGRP